MKFKIVFLFFQLTLVFTAFGQEYRQDISAQSLTIDGNLYPAFKTFIDFDHETVEKEWWRFAKKFGRPVNMREYYLTQIPGNQKSGTIPIKLYSKSLQYGKGCMFYLAIHTDQLDAVTEKKYINQINRLIFEFKLSIYRDHFQDQLKHLETRATDITGEIDRARGDAKSENKWFQELESINQSITEIKQKISELN